jgi:hypothetical protein
MPGLDVSIMETKISSAQDFFDFLGLLRGENGEQFRHESILVSAFELCEAIDDQLSFGRGQLGLGVGVGLGVVLAHGGSPWGWGVLMVVFPLSVRDTGKPQQKCQGLRF